MLTDSERTRLERLASSCAEFVGSEQRFCRLIRQHVRPLIDFSIAMVAIGPMAPRDPSVPKLTKLIGIDAPPLLMRAIRLASRVAKRTAFDIRLPTLDPVVLGWRELSAIAGYSRLRPLTTGYAAFHSHVDASKSRRAYILFAGYTGCPDDKAVYILRTITPLVALALSRLEKAGEQRMPIFTYAEREVIKWLREHSSNKEIARQRGKSAATVRNQLHAIYGKLGVRSRGAAIVKLETLHTDTSG